MALQFNRSIPSNFAHIAPIGQLPQVQPARSNLVSSCGHHPAQPPLSVLPPKNRFALAGFRLSLTKTALGNRFRMAMRPSSWLPLSLDFPPDSAEPAPPRIQEKIIMPYKTIVLGLIEQQPELHERLRKSKTMLRAMDLLAIELKESHETLKPAHPVAAGQRPEPGRKHNAGDRGQGTAAPPGFRLAPNESETFSLDEAMSYLRRRTPSA